MPGGNTLKRIFRKAGKGKRGRRGRGRGRGRGRRLTASKVSKLMMLKTAIGNGPAFQSATMAALAGLKL